MYSTEIQALIDQAEDELAACRERADARQSDLREVREEISRLEAELGAAYDDGLQERSAVENILEVNRRNASSIDGPQWAHPELRDIEDFSEHARAFAEAQLTKLDAVLNDRIRQSREHFGNGASSRELPVSPREPILRTTAAAERIVSIEYDPGEGSGRDLVSMAGGQVILTPIEPAVEATLAVETMYEFEVGDRRGAVPYRIFALTGLQDIPNEQRAEEFGIQIAASMLANEGRSGIVALGGPSKPDILSIDASGKLWLTEVKGSYKGTPLSRSGLLRTVKMEPLGQSSIVDPLSGTVKVWENSAEWLRRSGADVLKNLNQIEQSLDDSTALKSHVHELKMRYAQAVVTGFEAKDYCTEIFQVGALAEGDSLAFLDPHPTLHAYCADVEPARITQVTTGGEAV